MNKRSFKPGTMLNPVPVVMVSVGTMEGENNIITIAWTGIINSEPPMTYVSIRKERFSHHIIEENQEFVINLVNEKLTFATDFCGVKSGKDLDKWEVQNLTREKGKVVNVPMIKESPVNLECKVVDIKRMPTHDMYIGEIVNVNVDESLINENGRIELDKAKMVCYNHGEYFGIKREPLGKFGYSIMKPKTKKRLAKAKQGKFTKAKKK
ncbi:MAG: flavin reductase family protein [Anaerovoracaceae bacterium]